MRKHKNPHLIATHHNSIKLWILLPLRADLFVTIHYEIPCRIVILELNWQTKRKSKRCRWNPPWSNFCHSSPLLNKDPIFTKSNINGKNGASTHLVMYHCHCPMEHHFQSPPGFFSINIGPGRKMKNIFKTPHQKSYEFWQKSGFMNNL